MNPAGLTVSTPTDTTLVLTRAFSAPRRMVWEAFFTPERMRRWMLAPPGWSLSICECDPRTAGAIRLVWVGADGQPAGALHGVFTEVAGQERLVHTEVMLLGAGQPIGSQVETHEFTENNGVTTMRITQVYVSKEARDEAVASGATVGMEEGYKRLDAVLGRGE